MGSQRKRINMKRKIGKLNVPHRDEVQRRVVMAVNGHQFFIEELITTGKLSIWKIAKVYYSFIRAKKEMEKMK